MSVTLLEEEVDELAEAGGVDEYTVEASDVSGERVYTFTGISPLATVGEMVTGFVAEMELPQRDPEGRPLTYQARLEREGRHLHASETVGDALQPADRLVLHPRISAGAV
jgi:hypothetical protein